MLATVAAADSASTVRKKYSVFIYSEAEPHAMYAIYKQTLTLCVLQYALVTNIEMQIMPRPLSNLLLRRKELNSKLRWSKLDFSLQYLIY